MLNSAKLQEVTISWDNICDQIKNYLYQHGYASGKDEYIDHICLGALNDDNQVPVHFWIAKQEQEAFIEYSDGKGT